MAEKEHYEFYITVCSYKSVADKFKKKNNLTWDEVQDKLRRALQVNAWADAYPEMQDYLDWENSEDGKKFIAEQNKKSANNGGVRTQ